MVFLILGEVSNFILLVIQKTSYLGIFFLMLFQSVNVPIPSEIIMPYSGFLVQQGIFKFWLVVLTGALGNLIGALLSYKLAALLIKNGWRTRYGFLNILFNDRNIELAQRWFNRYGSPSIFFSRMIPVINTFISFPAGLGKMKILNFSVLTFAGSLIWSTFLTWLGFILGKNWGVVRVYFHEFDYLILGLILLAVGWWIWRHLKKPKAST